MRSAGTLLLVVATITILFLSLSPAPPSDGLGWDKANHAAAMAVVTTLAYITLRPARSAAIFAGAYALLLGILIELLQGLCTINRTAEWVDLAADAVGIALVLFAVKIFTGRIVVS